MKIWNNIPSDKVIETTKQSLQENGFLVTVVENGQQAKEKIIQLLPKGAEVMDMTSVTLDTIGVSQIITQSGDYDAVKKKLAKMDRKTQSREMQKIGAAPQWAVGSVHAVTENGEVIIASNTGSQLQAYIYGASYVVWVIGAQKIVKNIDDGMKRIYEYCLPLEAERAKKAYGAAGSNISKIAIVNKEINPKRITIILVREKLGF